MLISLNRKALRQTIYFSLLLLFCGHAFCYANLTFSGASVMLDADGANAALTASGQFLPMVYWRLRGSLAAPLLIGLLSAVYLTGSAVLIADLLALTHSVSLFALCGALTLHTGITAINAAMLHMADVYFLALLFASAGAWLCMRHPLGFIPTVCCAAACFGLQSSVVSVMPALVLTACLLRTLRGESVRTQCITAAKMPTALVAGFCGYYAAATLYAGRNSITLSASFQPTAEGILSRYLLPFRQLLSPATAYAVVCAALYLLLLVLGLITAAMHLRKACTASRVFAIIALLALPLVISMPVFSETAPQATCERLALCMLPIAIVAVLDLLPGIIPDKDKLIRIAVGFAFGITFLSSIVFANQVYLKKNLEYQTTLSVMTRVVEQAEQTEGVTPGSTPVAIVGTLEESSIAMAHKGFEHLSVLDAASNHYTAATQEQNTWYFWEILGYPFNFISDVERDALAETEAVQAMPAFPQSGFCAMHHGTLVIKLSPVQ